MDLCFSRTAWRPRIVATPTHDRRGFRGILAVHVDASRPDPPPAKRGTTRPVSATAIPTRRRSASPGGRAQTAPPVLVRQLRNGIEESVHRGAVVQAAVDGRLIRVIGDPDRLVTLRSTVKPFGLIALVEAGGIEAFDLASDELAVLASSHSGEDIHVRTLQGVLRRAGVSQALLACGTEDAPLDALTAARLARDGEKGGPIRHMCSGQHVAALLLARSQDWELEDYWHPEHPAQVAFRSAVARAFGTKPSALRTAIDGCGLETFAFALREVARTYAFLADPAAVPAGDSRSAVARPLTRIRDALLEHPEMIGGRHDRLDTSLMKAAPGRLISKVGMEALRGIAILPGSGSGTAASLASGLAVKIEDGDGFDRGTWAASVEALRQAGALEEQAVRMLARYRRPPTMDPRGNVAAEAVATFELAPVGELIG